MDISLEVQTNDASGLLIAMAGAIPARNEEIAVTDDVRLHYVRTETYRGIDLGIIFFALSFPVGIAANVISGIISDYLHRKSGDSASVERARLVITYEIEQIEANGHKTVTKRVVEKTIVDDDAQR
jgi:hypothetical protein